MNNYNTINQSTINTSNSTQNQEQLHNIPHTTQQTKHKQQKQNSIRKQTQPTTAT